MTYSSGGKGLPASGRDRSGGEALTLVLPAYNEEARLGPALDELFEYLAGCEDASRPIGLPGRIQVIVVDDGSTDGTAAIVTAHRAAAPQTIEASRDRAWRGAWLELLPVEHRGKGAAVRAGVLAAEGDYVVFADADMATPPSEIPRLVAALRGNDVALGSRVQLDGSDMRASQAFHRRLLGALFHRLAAVWVTGPVRDTQCGFKGFTHAAAGDLFARQRITSIVFDVELIYLARRHGYRIVEVPVRWLDRRGSRMRVGPRLAIRVGVDLARIPLVHRDGRQR